MLFHIENMTCGGCARSVEKAVQSVDPKAAVKADLAARKIEIISDLPANRFHDALEAAGYPPRAT